MLETSQSTREGVAGGEGISIDSDGRLENIHGTKGRATDYFIAESYRGGQREAIEAIENAFEQGFQYVLLDAPTGSGKSHIARAFAFQSGSAHVLTCQKILEDQYERDFGDMCIMKGRTAYRCLSEGGGTCADGHCRRSAKAFRHPRCPYAVAKKDAISAPVTVHNFDSFFYQNMHGRGFSGRKLLIIDEAHNIENKYGGFMSFTLSSKMGLGIPEYTRLKDYDVFVKKTYETLMKELNWLLDLFEMDVLNKEQVYRMEELGNLTRRMERFIDNRERDNPIEYIFDYGDSGAVQKVEFRPVMIGDFAEKILFPYGERVLMMSATILNKKLFCDSVGIPQEQVAYIEQTSNFPSEHRPIIKRYVGLMTYKKIDKTLPNLVEEIERILAKYPNRKGIIQTHSEKIAQYIQANLFDPRLTFNKDYATPLEMLGEHEKKDGSFIVASGLREGLDLRGESSKIQVFCKVPYPSLADKRVKRRMELDEQWYGYQTALMFVQALGRSVRSKQERAVTFILDSGFGYFYKRYKHFIPKYVKDAIKW